jgi:hypothetical protein
MPAARSCLPLLLALALAAAAASAHATIYKCLLDDGTVFYQDAPCAPGRELRDFDKDPGNVSVVPFAQPAPAASGKPSAAAAKPRAAAASGKTSEVARVPKPESRPAKKVPQRGDAVQRKFLHPGMSEGEVVARVGPPDMTSSGGRKGSRWTYMPVPEDPNTITNLQFDAGRVVEVERKVLH